MRFQPIYDIAGICHRKGIRHVVLCPGSRCAPLTLAFARHPHIEKKIISDERSAGYIALGMAQALREPVVVVCTSGTAVYNLAPAVAEAFFSETPLIVITADRPSEWIAQHDGQTIFQMEVFGKHVKKHYQLPQDYDHEDSRWAINRIVNDAINYSRQPVGGPVHINAPFREPLYPKPNETISFSEDVRIITAEATRPLPDPSTRAQWARELKSFERVLLVVGQHPAETSLREAISLFANKQGVPVIADIISNDHGAENHVHHADLFLAQLPENEKQSLRPDLLITVGQSVISKNVKLFLRAFSPRAHWHIQQGGVAADTFKSLTRVVDFSPEVFLRSLAEEATGEREGYAMAWLGHSRKAMAVLNGFFDNKKLSELEVVATVLNRLPPDSNLHLANSMSVRYANFFGLRYGQAVNVFSNRGTSGIDGCTSTAVGQYLATKKTTVLISGDMAFFYDRNAFWHNYPLENFRAVVLNNHGGLIFNMIDGPASMPEAQEYFITHQPLRAKNLCEEFGILHIPVKDKPDLDNAVNSFFTFDGQPKILEFEQDVNFNRSIFDQLKRAIRNSYES